MNLSRHSWANQQRHEPVTAFLAKSATSWTCHGILGQISNVMNLSRHSWPNQQRHEPVTSFLAKSATPWTCHGILGQISNVMNLSRHSWPNQQRHEPVTSFLAKSATPWTCHGILGQISNVMNLSCNSLSPLRSGIKLKLVIFKIVSKGRYDQSTLVQEMAWYLRHQAIIWTNADPDLCHYMASLGHNELKQYWPSLGAYTRDNKSLGCYCFTHMLLNTSWIPPRI